MNEKGIWLMQDPSPERLEILKAIAPEYRLVKGWGNETTDFPLEDIEIVFGWNIRKCAALLEIPNSRLMWIHAQSAGVDYMDLSLLKEKNILLTSSSGIHAIPIAESVFGMLLSYTRGVRQAILDQNIKQWHQKDKLIELQECTMMLVGTGHIGTRVGMMAKAFGMKTIGVNRSGREAENMDEIVMQQDMGTHVKEADIVVNILPLTELTRHFFNETVFSQMKEGTIFINVGRGSTVNTEDLISALDTGKIAFAGLDVFEEEPLPAASPLWMRKDVLITPHISGAVRHFKKLIFEIFEENLKAYVKGEELPRNKIDYERSY